MVIIVFKVHKKMQKDRVGRLALKYMGMRPFIALG